MLLPELWSHFKDKRPLFDVFVEVFERADDELLLQQTSPTRNKDQSNPSKDPPDVHQTTSKPSKGAVCASFPECFVLEYHSAPQKQQEKKSPRYLVKNTSLVAAVSRKRPHVQLKIPGSGVPARFCRLKHTIRRNGSGSDTRSTGILLFWPDTVRCRWARDGQNLWNETGTVL